MNGHSSSISSTTEERRGGSNIINAATTNATTRESVFAAPGRKDHHVLGVVVDSNKNDAEDDLDILRKEYRNMQANRNAFAHESDRVSGCFILTSI